MSNQLLLNRISFSLSSIEHCRLGKEWNYSNIISSFSRLYLITKGSAVVTVGEKQLVLKQGHLYLIPGFIQCSYKCTDYMEQYYATFSINLPNNLNIFQLYHFKNEVKAEPFHYDYFEKLCRLNRGMALPAGDPKIYQNQIKLGVEHQMQNSSSDFIKTIGLLNLFISEFIDSPKIKLESETHHQISGSIEYIHNHLHENITVALLADKCCFSPDYYTRKFKELTAQTPVEYINKHRIEKALILLNTTSETISEIAYKCGFSCTTYFGKIFKKYMNQTPREYRNKNAFQNRTTL